MQLHFVNTDEIKSSIKKLMSEILIYQSPDNQTVVEVKFDNETVWLTQLQLVELFQSSKANISEHIKSIFQSGELVLDATVRNFRTVRQEGKRTVSRVNSNIKSSGNRSMFRFTDCFKTFVSTP